MEIIKKSRSEFNEWVRIWYKPSKPFDGVWLDEPTGDIYFLRRQGTETKEDVQREIAKLALRFHPPEDPTKGDEVLGAVSRNRKRVGA